MTNKNRFIMYKLKQYFHCLAMSFTLLLIASPAAQAATYYMAPNGSNSGAGNSSSPWKTFPHAISRLNPGDTLILKDGNYTSANGSGQYIVLVTCGSNAKNGAPGAPITIRAENERQARLKSDAGSVMRFTKCSYWNIYGLTMTGADNAGEKGNGFVGIYESEHFEFKRNIFAYSNRWYNMGLITLVNSGYTLLEENEFYNFHRHAVTGAGAWNVTARRNYANGRDAKDVGKMLDSGLNSGNPDGGDVLFEMYPARDSIVENNVSENNMGVLGMPASGRYNVEARNNGLFGNISLNDVMGAKSDSRKNDLFHMPHDNLYVDLVVINPRNYGSYHRAAKNQLCLNCSVFGGEVGGFIADKNGSGAQGDGAPSVYYENVLAVGKGQGIGINSVEQAMVGVKNANITGYSKQLGSPGTSNTNYSGIMDKDPQMGSCKVFIPDGSPMKGAGTNGADIGANVLCRYENGKLTDTQLWNWQTGQFPCGAIYPGINDIAGSSCFDVHKRLNVNSNGCQLPANPVCKQPSPTIVVMPIGGGAGGSSFPPLLGPNGEVCYSGF
jgi:hypothetical protein